MARFEQRISEDDVTAARQKMAAGASLRSAAAEIPCAPSALSVRIKKAKAAEADAGGEAALPTNEHRTAPRAPGHPDARAIGAGGDARPGDGGPVEILRSALLATKANGQPDWPTRLSAVRVLAALRPEEFEPKKEQPAEPSIIVYDLPPGAAPVLHRASEGAEAPVSHADEPSVEPPSSTSTHIFICEPPEGGSVFIGTWSPADPDQSADNVSIVMHRTGERETAERWLAELSAGSLPMSAENVP